MLVERIASAVESRLARARETVTVSALWRAYDAAHQHLHWWRNTRSLMGPTVRAFGDRDVMSLTRSDWRQHIAGRGVTRGTPMLLLKRFRSMLRWARKERLLPQALEHTWFEVSAPRGPSPRRTEIDDTAIDRLATNGGFVWGTFFLLAIDTGLRSSEVLSMRWEWVDLDEGFARLPPASVKNDEPREFALSARTMTRLRKLRQRSDSTWIFASPRTAKPYSRAWAWQRFRRLANALELAPAPGDGSVHLHDARGTSAARVIRAGANLRELMHHLGIRSVKTADAYIQRFSDEDRQRHRALVNDAARGVRKDRTR